MNIKAKFKDNENVLHYMMEYYPAVENGIIKFLLIHSLSRIVVFGFSLGPRPIQTLGYPSSVRPGFYLMKGLYIQSEQGWFHPHYLRQHILKVTGFVAG